MPRHALTLLLAAGLGLAAAGAASAAPDPTAETTTVHVRVADLNLSSDAGARVALRRITHAARTICGDEPDAREMARQAIFQACVRSVVDQAVADAGSPTLAALNGGPAMRPTSLAAAN